LDKIRKIKIKYRPTIAVVDAEAVSHNFNEVRRLAGSGSPVAPVIKSDAYGHGWRGISSTLVKAGADRFCVSLTEEALALRKAGIKTAIYVLGGVYPNQAKQIILNKLTPIVSDFEMVRALNESAKALKKTVDIHVKVDTGLGRLGILEDDVASFFESLKKIRWVNAEGICSSFSSISDLENSKKQFKNFEKIVKKAESVFDGPLIAHMAHSGGILHGLTRPGWMVRPGIILYGYTRDLPLKGLTLKPALTWKTEIFKVQTFPARYPIGYGGRYKTKKDSRIALLPVGYSDGLFRSYIREGQVLIREKRAPIVGSISMDWTMVEVGHIKGVKAGDEVILIGFQGKDRISADEMAECAGTIIDEVFVSINKRVSRKFL